MEDYCQNETMKKLCQKDPILYFKIMSYDRQQAQDSKELEKFICTYRQHSMNILRKVQQNIKQEIQYKFPININLKSKYDSLQKEAYDQNTHEFQILKGKKYNLYSQNYQSQNNKRSNSSCLKKRNLFIIKKKDSISNNFSQNGSKNDSFQLKSPTQLCKRNPKQILKRIRQKQNLTTCANSQYQQQSYNKNNQKIFSRPKSNMKYRQNTSSSYSQTKQESQNSYNKYLQQKLRKTCHSNSQKEKYLDKKYLAQYTKPNKSYNTSQQQRLIVKKNGLINISGGGNKSKFHQLKKKLE